MSTSTERIFTSVARFGPTATGLITRALDVAATVHHGELRRSGDPYITHPLAVAATVAEAGADVDTIAAALLHDVPIRTAYPCEQLRAEFGDRIVDLLQDFVVLDRAGSDDIPSGVDPRATLLKIADRLHNMQTIRHLNTAKQQRKADQTLRVIVPVARSLGLGAIADELEVLAAETLRASTAHSMPAGAGRPDGIGVSRRLIRIAGRLLLPARCRERWLAEWEAELHVLTTRRGRLTFTTHLLTGLPAMSVLARRQPTRDGNER